MTFMFALLAFLGFNTGSTTEPEMTAAAGGGCIARPSACKRTEEL